MTYRENCDGCQYGWPIHAGHDWRDASRPSAMPDAPTHGYEAPLREVSPSSSPEPVK